MTERAWRSRLGDLIREFRNTPHQYGQHDCILWSCRARAVRTGHDLAAHHRGTYSTARGARRVLWRHYGVATPWEVADLKLGPRLPPSWARVAHVVAADLGDGPCLGICFGARSYFAGDDGLVALPTLEMEHCYHG